MIGSVALLAQCFLPITLDCTDLELPAETFDKLNPRLLTSNEGWRYPMMSLLSSFFILFSKSYLSVHQQYKNVKIIAKLIQNKNFYKVIAFLVEVYC